MCLSAMIDIQYKMTILFVFKVYYLCFSYNVKLSNAELFYTVYIMLNEYKISIFINKKQYIVFFFISDTTMIFDDLSISVENKHSDSIA